MTFWYQNSGRIALGTFSFLVFVWASTGGGSTSYFLIVMCAALTIFFARRRKDWTSVVVASVALTIWGSHLIGFSPKLEKSTWVSLDVLFAFAFLLASILDSFRGSSKKQTKEPPRGVNKVGRSVPTDSENKIAPTPKVPAGERVATSPTPITQRHKPVQTDWDNPGWGIERPSRNSPRLYHFTRVQNLGSIDAHGLLSNAVLIQRGIRFTPNDTSRHDRRILEGGEICLSVGHPQAKMMKSLDSQEELVVLEIDPSVLLRTDFWAFPTNAARREMLAEWRKSPECFVGRTAFDALFEDTFWMASSVDGRQKAERPRGFFEDYPNDPQAELVFENVIPRSKIVAMHFQSETARQRFAKSVAPNPRHAITSYLSSPELFTYRADPINWKSRWVDPREFARAVSQRLR